MRPLLASFLVAFLVPAIVNAKDAEGVVQHEYAPAALDPSKAYLLFDSSRAKSGVMKITHVFMRIPNLTDLEAFRAAREAEYQRQLPRLKRRAKREPVPTRAEFEFSWDDVENTFAVNMGEALGESDTFLIEVPPGTYVLYGIAVGTHRLATCNCLGTVKFDATPGVITQMGSLYADKVHEDSPVPHLEDNLGEQMGQYSFIFGQALVPANADDDVPASLARFASVLAQYVPVGMFTEPGAASINRLVPIPGVLEYERGRVVLSPREDQ